jgi:uncharacterized protein YceK
MNIQIDRCARVALLLAIACTGCGTIYRGDIKGIYPATKYDVLGINMGIHGVGRNGTPSPSMALGCTIDLPISLVTDTVLLPYDLHKKHKEVGQEEEAPSSRLRRGTYVETPTGSMVVGDPTSQTGDFDKE